MTEKGYNIIAVCFFTICGLFISCGDPAEEHAYIKAFFIADDSFLIEGEVFDGNNTNFRLDKPANIDFIIAKTRSDAVEGWEISGTVFSGTVDGRVFSNKYELLISTTANGVTIGSETINSNGYKSLKSAYLEDRFPENFPVCEVGFYINAYKYCYNPIMKSPDYSEKYPAFYDYYYIYVAEPIDVSGIVTEDYKDPWWGMHTIRKYHYELNFPKPGWYKILRWYNSLNAVNEQTFSSGKDTYFGIGN
jgi:hypothetical protein